MDSDEETLEETVEGVSPGRDAGRPRRSVSAGRDGPGPRRSVPRAAGGGSGLRAAPHDISGLMQRRRAHGAGPAGGLRPPAGRAPPGVGTAVLGRRVGGGCSHLGSGGGGEGVSRSCP